MALQSLCIWMVITILSIPSSARHSTKVGFLLRENDENSGTAVQRLVNKVFGEPGNGDATPFREFHSESNQKLDQLLRKLTNIGLKSSSPEVRDKVPVRTDKKGLVSAINYAWHSITKRDVNPSLVRLALGIYLTHNNEANHLGVVVPPLKEHSGFKNIKKQPLSNPVTADTMKGVEILSYFRNDYDLNEHHWHWHLVYPYAGIRDSDKKHHRTIERQGELFLYMHGQMIARYNAELLSWGLNTTHPWSYDDIVPFGYTPVPGLRDTYGSRPKFRGWFEDGDENATVSKKLLAQWRDNIYRAIDEGFFYTTKAKKDSGKLMLTPANVMNWVGVVVEAENPDLQNVSPGEYINDTMYGNLHNIGHSKFAEIGYHEYTSAKNPLGVMIDNSGSLRDPCFWLWHSHIDDFRKIVIDKYNHSIDEFAPDAKIIELEIMPQDLNSVTPKGGLATFLGPPQLEINEANAKIDHEPYEWRVTVRSTRIPPPSKANPHTFTVRIFIVPKAQIEDKYFWIEMDKFTHTLTRPAEILVRMDTESSVARNADTDCKNGGSKGCLCGWPPSMMLPNGTPEGIEYVGFAMLTDDKLSDAATQAVTFCGTKDNKYPDPRGMGYPFDKTWSRRIHSSATVPEIVDDLPHTKLCEFKIYRFTKLYQGAVSTPPTPSNITWENTIKDFFTPQDTECMIAAANINLGDKDNVILHAEAIYNQVKTGQMPLDEAKWSSKKVTDFKTWIDAGSP